MTKHIGGYKFQYTDLRYGEVEISWFETPEKTLKVPGDVLLELVAQYVAEQRVAMLNSETMESLLGLPYRGGAVMD